MSHRRSTGPVNTGPAVTRQTVPGVVAVQSRTAYAAGIMASDDQEVEAWCLEGWAFISWPSSLTTHQMGNLKVRAWLGRLGKGCEGLFGDLQKCRCSEYGVFRASNADGHETVAYSSRAWRWPDTGTCEGAD